MPKRTSQWLVMLTALIISTCSYNVGARLPHAMSQSGFNIIAICPINSPICVSDYITWGRAYHGTISISRLTELVCEARSIFDIDIIVPCDDLAAACLDNIRTRASEHSAFDAVKQLLSTWQKGFSATARTRSRGVEVARSIGLRTPQQVVLADGTSAPSLAELGSPIVVKQDFYDGGTGVSITSAPQEALDVASEMSKREQFAEGARIVAQEFIAGQSASVSFSAHQGRLLEAFTYVAVHQHPARTGAASVISVIENPELVDATRRVVEAFGYSGFGGVDFVMPSDGSSPIFLELNARPTQTAHLGSLFGADLFRAMACSLSDQPYTSAFDTNGLPPIALFPAEWLRDPNSQHLLRSYHDVPWYDRRIAAAAINFVSQNSTKI